MKTFKDLEFKSHPTSIGTQAKMNFSNNFGISVIKCLGSYGYEKDLWEVGVLYNGSLTYNTDITNDVLGYQTEQDVTNVMKKVQMLKE